MAKKQIDGDGLDIPNRIKALPVKRTGPIVAAVIVALLAAIHHDRAIRAAPMRAMVRRVVI